MSLLVRALSATAICMALTVGAAAEDIQERTIRWGHLNNTDHPVSMGVQKFAEILLAKSGGKMKVREFAASQLGNELQQQSALRGGTQEMLSASTTSLATVVPEFGLIDFPFLFNSTEQADALATGAFGKAMLDVLPMTGVQLPDRRWLRGESVGEGGAVRRVPEFVSVERDDPLRPILRCLRRH